MERMTPITSPGISLAKKTDMPNSIVVTFNTSWAAKSLLMTGGALRGELSALTPRCR